MIVYAIQNELSRVAQFKKKSNFEKNFYVFVLGEPPKSQGGVGVRAKNAEAAVE